MNNQKRKKLLTIISEEKLRSLIGDSLNGDTYDVVSAADGLDAFHKLVKEYFDLIITDFRMPGLAGVNMLLPRLREIQSRARVIVIPTRRFKREERKLIESKADACLEQPFQVKCIKEIIDKMFATSEEESIQSKTEWVAGRLSLEAR